MSGASADAMETIEILGTLRRRYALQPQVLGAVEYLASVLTPDEIVAKRNEERMQVRYTIEDLLQAFADGDPARCLQEPYDRKTLARYLRNGLKLTEEGASACAES